MYTHTYNSSQQCNIQQSRLARSNSFFQWSLLPEKPFSSALEEAKSAQISERIALLALADADHLQKSFFSAGAGFQGRQSHREAAILHGFWVKIGLHHVTPIMVCSHTAPYCLSGTLFRRIFLRFFEYTVYVIHPEPLGMLPGKGPTEGHHCSPWKRFPFP